MVPNPLRLENTKGASPAPFFALLLGIAAGLFWLLAWLDPNHYPPWVVFENEASAFLALLLASLALHMAGAKVLLGQRIRVSAAVLFWLAVIITAIAVQYAVGLTSLQQGLLGLLYLAALGLSFVAGNLAFVVADDHHSVWETRACWGILLTTLLSAAIVLLQYFGIEDLFPMVVAQHGNYRPFGNLGQPNNQATLLVMGIACLDLLVRRQRMALGMAALALGVLIPAVVATGSRSGVLGALCVAFYLCVVGARKERTFTLIWAASLLLLFLCMPAINQLFAKPAARSAAEVFTDNARVTLYTRLLYSLVDHPWLGYGFGNTGYAQSQMALQGYVGDPVTNAHNLPLELLIWFGIPLGVILIASSIRWGIQRWRSCPKHYRPLYGVLIPFLVHAMVELPYTYSFFLLTFMFVTGYVVMASPHTGTTGWSAKKSLVLGLSIAVAGSLIAYDYLRCVDEFTIARFEYRKVGSAPSGHTAYEPMVLKDIQGQLDALRAPVGKDMDPQTVNTLTEQALRQHIPLAHTKLISYYLITGNLEAAELEIRRFRNLYKSELKALNWGSEDLQNNFCAASEQENKASPQCKLIRAYFH